MEKQKQKQPEYGQWIILATAGDGYFIADRFIYSFNLKDEDQRSEALESALYDAAFQTVKYGDAIYIVVET